MRGTKMKLNRTTLESVKTPIMTAAPPEVRMEMPISNRTFPFKRHSYRQ